MNEIFDPNWQALLARFLFNLLIVTVISRLFYYHKNKGSREQLFTYITLSAIVFIICLILKNVPVEIGFALGLFAIFSIIRYRSVRLSSRELAYLFITIGLGVYNSLANIDTNVLRILVGNLLIVAVTGITEWLLFGKGRISKLITYDRIDLITKERRAELEKDIGERFNITDIQQIQVGEIDAVKNRVKLKVTFRDREGNNFQ